MLAGGNWHRKSHSGPIAVTRQLWQNCRVSSVFNWAYVGQDGHARGFISGDLSEGRPVANPIRHTRELVLKEITDCLERGETVKLSSFGLFVVRQKGQRLGRNPRTGEEVPISPRRVVVFKPSAVLKQRINAPRSPFR